MICFEVLLNGERLCTAGVTDGGGLQALVNHVGRGLAPEVAPSAETPLSMPQLTVAGMHRPNPTSVPQSLWIDRFLQVGDVVTLRIVEQPKTDPPEYYDVKSDAGLREMQREHMRQARERLDD